MVTEKKSTFCKTYINLTCRSISTSKQQNSIFELMNKKINNMNRAMIAFVMLFIAIAPPAIADLVEARKTVDMTFNSIYAALYDELEGDLPLEDAATMIIENNLLPRINVHKFSKLILGKYWKDANVEQRQQFIDILTQFLIRTTVKTVVENPDLIRNYLENVTVSDVQPGRNDDRAVVTMLLKMPNRPERTIAFRMSRDSGDWLLYDVVFEGVSFAVNYRTILNSEIKKHGIEAVAADLESKLSR